VYLELIQFPDFNPFLFGPIELGNFPLGIRWYSLAYVVGLVGGVWLAARMIKIWGVSVTTKDLDNLFIWLVLGVVLGGRFFYVLFYGLTTAPYLYSNPISWVAAWDGGMSFHGGMFGVALAIVVYAWTKKGVGMLELGDFIAAVAPIGLFLGRCANFINGELWGRQSDVPWAVLFPRAVLAENGINATGIPEDQIYSVYQSIIDQGGELIGRHPSQLYEAFFEGLILFIILQLLIRTAWIRARCGFVSGAFLLGYGVFRWSLEWLREPDALLGTLDVLYPGSTMGQLLSLPMILLGSVLLFWSVRKPPQKP